MEQVILVDEQDNETGAMEKLEAHQKGLLHRAFSVLVFNSKGELLLQKRAKSKYHSGGLWTNTCCSHPHPGESIVQAGKRKLLQEMGFECELYLSHKFIYQVELDNNLIENECDYVMIGSFDGSPSINLQEAEDWKYESMESIRHDAAVNPDAYSYWFRLILNHPQLITKKPDPVY